MLQYEVSNETAESLISRGSIRSEETVHRVQKLLTVSRKEARIGFVFRIIPDDLPLAQGIQTPCDPLSNLYSEFPQLHICQIFPRDEIMQNDLRYPSMNGQFVTSGPWQEFTSSLITSLVIRYLEKVSFIPGPIDAILVSKYDTGYSEAGTPGIWFSARASREVNPNFVGEVGLIPVDLKVPSHKKNVEFARNIMDASDDLGISDWKMVWAMNSDTIDDPFAEINNAEIYYPAFTNDWREIDVYGTPSEIAVKEYDVQEFEDMVGRIVDITGAKQFEDRILIPWYDNPKGMEFRDVMHFETEPLS